MTVPGRTGRPTSRARPIPPNGRRDFVPTTRNSTTMDGCSSHPHWSWNTSWNSTIYTMPPLPKQHRISSGALACKMHTGKWPRCADTAKRARPPRGQTEPPSGPSPAICVRLHGHFRPRQGERPPRRLEGQDCPRLLLAHRLHRGMGGPRRGPHSRNRSSRVCGPHIRQL